MSTIKSSAENLTLNADGANNDIKFQSNGSEVASIDQAGTVTATSFAGSGASLTGLTAAQMPTPICGTMYVTNTWTLSNATVDIGASAELSGMTFNNTNNSLVIATAGIYSVSYMAWGSVTSANANDGVALEIHKQGSVITVYSRVHPASTLGSENNQEWTMSNTLIVTCAANDELTLVVSGLGAASGNLQGGQVTAYRL